eukprot:s1134_g12.t1
MSKPPIGAIDISTALDLFTASSAWHVSTDLARDLLPIAGVHYCDSSDSSVSELLEEGSGESETSCDSWMNSG